MLRVLALLLCVSVAYADFAPPRPTPGQKTIGAGIVLVGTIVDVEKDPISAPTVARNEGKQDFTMITIKITDGIVGCTGLTQIRMGVAPLDLGPRRGSFAIEGLEVKKDYTACFFLSKHPKADFYICHPWFHPLPKTSATFEKDLAEVKSVAKIVDDPLTALKAKELDMRAKAAHLLFTRYNAYPIGATVAPTREAIGAEESKLILNTIKELPWVGKDGLNRQQLWYQLQLTEKDGWNPGPVPPGMPNEFMEAETKKWLDKNAETFRVKKWVPGVKK